MRWFLYGSLLDPVVLARRSGRPGLAPGAAARLAGWQRVARATGRYPTLRRARGGAVAGVVLIAPATARRRLAAYEGPAYRLRPVVVATTRGPRPALVWIAADPLPRLWPARTLWKES